MVWITSELALEQILNSVEFNHATCTQTDIFTDQTMAWFIKITITFLQHAIKFP